MLKRKKVKRPQPESRYGLKDDFKQTAVDIARTPLLAGPNSWDKITGSDFSFSFDYIAQPLDPERVIIDPTSKAALHWCYRFLPEDTPRYGTCGFIVEKRYAAMILEAMGEASLFSEAEYVHWMENEERDRRQGENR